MQQLHIRANTYMDKDAVRPAQAASYKALMLQVHPILLAQHQQGMSNAHGVAASLPPAVRARLTEIMREAGLPKSHVWVKGLVATWMAVYGS